MRNSKRVKCVDSAQRRKLGTSVERHWFFGRGLLGEDFHWETEYSAWTTLPSHLNRMRTEIADMAAANPGSVPSLREIALEALDSEEVDHVRRGIQVLCAVGTDDDLSHVRSLREHADPDVARDARSCLFERGIKLR